MANRPDLGYKMAKTVVVLALMVLAVVVEGRDWRFESVKRMKRGYNGGYGIDGTYGQSDEHDASISREKLNGCSGESDKSYSGSGERLSYNKDDRSNENRRGHRAFSKASASASASAFSQNHNLGV